MTVDHPKSNRPIDNHTNIFCNRIDCHGLPISITNRSYISRNAVIDWSSISNINRLIYIDYYRLIRGLSILFKTVDAVHGVTIRTCWSSNYKDNVQRAEVIHRKQSLLIVDPVCWEIDVSISLRDRSFITSLGERGGRFRGGVKFSSF